MLDERDSVKGLLVTRMYMKYSKLSIRVIVYYQKQKYKYTKEVKTADKSKQFLKRAKQFAKH
jgi:hypothetical protein